MNESSPSDEEIVNAKKVLDRVKTTEPTFNKNSINLGEYITK